MINVKKLLLVLIVMAGLTVTIILPRSANQPLVPQIVYAAAQTCPDIVKAALKSVDTRCASTGRNSLCYGNVQVQVTPLADAPKFTFANPGDKAPLKNIQSLQLNSLSADANDWGIALMRIQANLPDTAPGQNVTMLLFGNVQISDGSTTAVYPTDEPTIALSAPAPLPTFTPTSSGKITSTPRATPRPTRTPRPTATPSNTPTPKPTTPPAFKSMQAFYFSSGVGEPACNQAPEDGILIQSPKGNQKITLMVNDAKVVMGSTVFFQAQAGKEMIISTLEGSAEVTAFGQTSFAKAGSRIHVPIDANLKASGPPSQPEPYDLDTMKTLPAQHLPLKVTPVPPIDALEPGYVYTTWRISYSVIVPSGGQCDLGPATSFLYLSATNGTSSGGLTNSDTDFSYTTPRGDVGQVHRHIETHYTSSTHYEGTYSDTAIFAKIPRVCRWTASFQADQIGGPILDGSATAAATAAQ